VHVERPASLHQRVPEFHAQIGAFKIDLEATLPRIARPHHGQRPPLEVEPAEAEEPDIAHGIAEDRGHQILGPGTLNGQGRDIGFFHKHVEPHAPDDPLDPE